MSAPDLCAARGRGAMLDEAHSGDIRGALGIIRHGDIAPRDGWWPRFHTLLTSLGPGLIVMAGDNEAGAFGTFTRADHDYGTSLLRTLSPFVPVRADGLVLVRIVELAVSGRG